MKHTHTSSLFHVVFSTKDRRRTLTNKIRERLFPYFGGIARQNEMKALATGGVEDHVHLLLSIPATISIAKAVQLIKGNSSKWLNETFPQEPHFEWQEGYGAFSIGLDAIEKTTAYIREQAEHHRIRTFDEEYEAFLARHGFAFSTTVTAID